MRKDTKGSGIDLNNNLNKVPGKGLVIHGEDNLLKVGKMNKSENDLNENELKDIEIKDPETVSINDPKDETDYRSTSNWNSDWKL
jgi:hypothetical protein